MLRPYQETGVKGVRGFFAKGINPLLKAPTGSGKTVIFCWILKQIFSKDKRAIVVVRGRKLVDQASRRLIRESVPHGVLMANHWNYRPHERIQVCSIDTLTSRKLYPRADLVIIDEAHLFASDMCIDYFRHYRDAYRLPVTATPYTDKPLLHLAETILDLISMDELIKLGYLVPPRYFAPNIPDLTGVRMQSGDYKKDELQNVMMDATLVGDLVTHWKRFGENRPTLVFAVSVEHSKGIVEAFKNAGIKAVHRDANSNDNDRDKAIQDLQRGKKSIISNVGIFCTGIDIPELSCLVLARPTKSYTLYIQQSGRGTRPSPGKKDFIILDHAGNCLRHGFIEDEKEGFLDGKQKRQTEKSISPKRCGECFAVYKGKACPNCGHASSKAGGPRQFEVIEGNLTEITESVEIHKFIKEKRKVAKEDGHPWKWIFWRTADKFGEEVARKHLGDRYEPKMGGRIKWQKPIKRSI